MAAPAAKSKVKNLIVECNLQSLVLEQDVIEVKSIPGDKLYIVNFDGDHIGPVFRDDLKQFFKENPEVFTQITLKSTVEENWLPAVQHPHFQRRTRGANTAQPEANTYATSYEDKYFLLRQGEKIGPFAYSEMMQKIKNKEVLFTDLVSVKDNPWVKVHEVEIFNRRTPTDQETPPTLPESEVFDNSDREVFQGLQTPSKEYDYSEAIAGLAYIGQMKEGDHTLYKGSNSAPKDEEEEPVVEVQVLPTKNKKPLKIATVFMLLVIVVAGVDYFKNNKKMSNNSRPGRERNVAASDEESSEQNDKVAKKQRRAKPMKVSRRARELANIDEENSEGNKRPRRGRSFNRSPNYRMPSNKDLSNDPSGDSEDDDFYEGDSDDPVELDPVQNKLSKETIDPEDEGTPARDAGATEDGEKSAAASEEEVLED